jgi:hypothetical protein
MKIKLLVSILIFSEMLFGQNFSPIFNPIIIDSNLSNIFFLQSPFAHQSSGGTTIVTDMKTGKSDTTFTAVKEADLIVNCKIDDPGRHHLGFDNCISYIEKDTLVIQFQNNNSNSPSTFYWDKMILHLIKNQFYAEYIRTSKTFCKFVVERQTLTLKSLKYRRGERLMGELAIHFENKDIKPTCESFKYKGPFNVVVE